MVAQHRGQPGWQLTRRGLDLVTDAQPVTGGQHPTVETAIYPEGERRPAAQVGRDVDTTTHGECGPQPGADDGPDRHLRAGGDDVGHPQRPRHPIDRRLIAAPPRAITVNSSNRSVGPLPVSSRAAAEPEFPTTRLAKQWERSSMGPLGGTPTCQYPMRPGRS